MKKNCLENYLFAFLLGILIYCLFVNYLEPLENQVSNRAIYPEIKDIPYREFSDDEGRCPFKGYN